MKFITKRTGTTGPLIITLLGLIITSQFSFAQYEDWSAPRLLSEYRQMLVGMDRVIKDLDQNIKLADTLANEKTRLDALKQEIDSLQNSLAEPGARQNADAAQFNTECIENPPTTDEEGQRCNTWSDQLNATNAELTRLQSSISSMIEDYNSGVEAYNQKETTRAREAIELDQRYDELERNAGIIDSRLSSKEETSDIYRRCTRYSDAETKQRCMQKFWDDEN